MHKKSNPEIVYFLFHMYKFANFQHPYSIRLADCFILFLPRCNVGRFYSLILFVSDILTWNLSASFPMGNHFSDSFLVSCCLYCPFNCCVSEMFTRLQRPMGFIFARQLANGRKHFLDPRFRVSLRRHYLMTMMMMIMFACFYYLNFRLKSLIISIRDPTRCWGSNRGLFICRLWVRFT